MRTSARTAPPKSAAFRSPPPRHGTERHCRKTIHSTAARLGVPQPNAFGFSCRQCGSVYRCVVCVQSSFIAHVCFEIKEETTLKAAAEMVPNSRGRNSAQRSSSRSMFASYETVPARVLRGFEYSTPVVFLSATRARCIELTVQVGEAARRSSHCAQPH